MDLGISHQPLFITYSQEFVWEKRGDGSEGLPSAATVLGYKGETPHSSVRSLQQTSVSELIV